MPGVSRFGLNEALKHLKPLVDKGLKSILLFGVVDQQKKVRILIKRPHIL